MYQPELRCEDISFAFSHAGKSAQKNSLHDLSISLKAGDRLGLLGPNGAGKTTLLRVLAGIYPPTKGRVFANGKITLLANLMACLEPEFSGYKNIELSMAYWGIPPNNRDAVIDDVLTFTELGSAMNERLDNYSAGMKMRLAFALATYAKPDILLIDEVMGVGDAAFKEKSRARLAAFSEDLIVVLAAHNKDLLLSFCSMGAVVRDGKIEYYGSISNALDFEKRRVKNL